jgi:peptide/nickel transport system substrate-binding protein
MGQLGDIASLDAHSFAFLNYGMIPQVYDRLAHYDQDLKLQPELAESWDLASDGLLLNLKLRQGVKFHNGREMTSDDVVANYTKARDKTTAGTSAAVQTVDTVTATDKYGVRSSSPLRHQTCTTRSAHVDHCSRIIQGHQQKRHRTGPFKLTAWMPGGPRRFSVMPTTGTRTIPTSTRW